MNTKFVIDSKSPRTDEINALCEKVLKYEIRIQFFETKIAELSQQFKIPQKLRTPQHLSQTDFNTLHILGLSIQQVQALPSVGLTSFALFNLFSCLVMITHLLLFQTASEWGNLYPAYIECSLFFLICFCAGIMFRATRVTRRIDEVLWSIGAILGLILAFGSVQRLVFYAEHLSTFNLHKNLIPAQIFQLYTQPPSDMWAQFLLIILCILGGLVFYVSSYLFAASPDISNLIHRYPNLFQINTNETRQEKHDLTQEIYKANNSLKAFARLQSKLISECSDNAIFAHLEFAHLSENQNDLIVQIQEQLTYLAIDTLNLEQQQQLEYIQDLFSRIQLLAQNFSSLQQKFEQFNNITAESI